MTIDTTKPSRELDAAVARAMGHTIYMPGSLGWREWDGDPDEDLYLDYGEFGKRELPRYSAPVSVGSRSAVLSMILWLMERNIVLLERTKEGKTLVDLTDGSGDTDSNVIEGDPLQALALALCQVVVRVGGLE